MPDCTGNTRPKYKIGVYKFDFQEVKIKTPAGLEVTAFVVTAVYDLNDNQLPLADEFKSNCTGYAVAGGEVWITDLKEPDGQPDINQAKPFEDLLTSETLFKEVPKAEADFVIASWNGEIIHSGEYNPATDTYTWKNNYDPVKNGLYAEFSATYDDYLTVKYYKRNY